jgi:murein DD-endopeptidase MepM/ murein hydrolase activator NlpD
MSLLDDLFNFISQKRSLVQKEQQSQAIKAFILEPILTPSGLVDDPTHGADAIIIDPNPAIDHHFDFPLDNDPDLDHAHDPDFDFPTTFIAPEDIDPLPFIYDPEPAIPSIEGLFNAGIFTVGESGKVSIDYLFDGGGYQGQLAIFNLNGMEGFDLNTETGLADFIHEAASRALSNSDLGHVVIADATEGAKFSGMMPSEWENHNFGEYQGVRTFDMQAGDRFAVMLVPNGTVQQVLDGNQDADIRPLFSLNTVNPNEAFHAGQIADVTGDGNTFVLEDLRTDGATDRDYNDIIFQVRGATGTAVNLDEVINPELDWRHSDTGHAIIEYVKAYVEPVNPVETSLPIAEVPVSHQPLIGIIDTGVSANNPDIDYSRLILGRDYIDGDNNPLLASGEGSEHGTHILGIIGATQNNGEGIDGINDRAPIWVGRAVGSGHWADSLVEFVDQARETNQPHAIANLSLDLTQINPDGSVTTRYEFTPTERAAIEYARQNGVLIVTAAGNDGGVMSALGQASQEFDNIITVGAAERVNDSLALSEAFNRADYSSYGYGLDIVAPGGTVDNPELSTVGDGVGTLAGTSIATAKVTGAASQVWAANPDLSYRQVIEILKDTSTDLNTTGWDAETGTGLLNIAAAVSLAQATAPKEYDVLETLIPETWSGEGKVIPTERAARIPYTFRAGDTLWGIAQRELGNGNRWTEIKKANGSTFTTAEAKLIQPGQSVYLPVSYQSGSGTPATPPPVSNPTPTQPTQVNYVNSNVGSISFNMRSAASTSGQSGYVNSNVGSINLNMRSAASTSAGIIATLPKGTNLTILRSVTGVSYSTPNGNRSDWYEVQVGSQKGYVAAYYVSTGTSQPATEPGYVNSNVGSVNLNMRSAASTSAGIVATLPKGSNLTILRSVTGSSYSTPSGNRSDWYEVQAGNQKGYVAAYYVTKGTNNTNPTNPQSWQNPLPGYRITSGYGWRTDPKTGKRKFHWGIDIGTGGKTPPVKAAFAGWNDQGYGNLVIIEHGDGTRSYYAHLSSISVSSGTSVNGGTTIGNVGSTGYSTGNHLHFEVRVSPFRSQTDNRDPRNYVQF